VDQKGGRLRRALRRSASGSLHARRGTANLAKTEDSSCARAGRV
jgi:hypothetical protein